MSNIKPSHLSRMKTKLCVICRNSRNVNGVMKAEKAKCELINRFYDSIPFLGMEQDDEMLESCKISESGSTSRLSCEEITVCPQCCPIIKSALESRNVVELVESDVRKIQRHLLNEIRQLQRFLDVFYDTLKKIETLIQDNKSKAVSCPQTSPNLNEISIFETRINQVVKNINAWRQKTSTTDLTLDTTGAVTVTTSSNANTENSYCEVVDKEISSELYEVPIKIEIEDSMDCNIATNAEKVKDADENFAHEEDINCNNTARAGKDDHEEDQMSVDDKENEHSRSEKKDVDNDEECQMSAVDRESEVNGSEKEEGDNGEEFQLSVDGRESTGSEKEEGDNGEEFQLSVDGRESEDNRSDKEENDNDNVNDQKNNSIDDGFKIQIRRKYKPVAKTNVLSEYCIDFTGMSPFKMHILSRILQRKNRILRQGVNYKNEKMKQRRNGFENPSSKYYIDYNVQTDMLFVEDITIVLNETDAQNEYLKCSKCEFCVSYTADMYPDMKMLYHILGKHLSIFRCEHCEGLVFTNRKSFLEHMHESCDVCGKPFSNQRQLGNHKWSHMNEEEQKQAAYSRKKRIQGKMLESRKKPNSDEDGKAIIGALAKKRKTDEDQPYAPNFVVNPALNYPDGMSEFKRYILARVIKRREHHIERNPLWNTQGCGNRTGYEDPGEKYFLDYCAETDVLSVEDVTLTIHGDDVRTGYIDCSKCGFRVHRIHDKNTDMGMLDHVLSAHLNAFHCQHCGKTNTSRYSYLKHVREHLSGIPCDICGKILARERGLRRHRWLHKSEEEKQQIIKSGGADPLSYIKRLAGKTLQCFTCGMVFKTKGSLNTKGP